MKREPELIRSFIAINLEESLRPHLSWLQDTLRTAGAEVSWVRVENIHLTLKFLGEVTKKRLDVVKEAIKEVTRTGFPFPINLQGLGVFPNLRSPRVVWVGVEEETGELKRLQGDLEKVLSKKGFPKEGRPYTPHLTLGRVRSPKNKEGLVALLEAYKGESLGGMQVKSMELMQSQLFPKGAVYSILESFPLGRLEI